MAQYERPKWTPPSFLRFDTNPYQPTSPASDSGPIIDVTPNSVETSDAIILPEKPSLDQIPVRTYSQIVPAQFIQHKLTPQRIIPIANVEYMDWEFDEPRDDGETEDNELRVYVSISEEERAIIRRYGYHHEALEKDVPLFDLPDLAALQQAQDQELQAAPAESHAFLRMEHKQQLEWAEEQKINITIIDYLAGPYKKQCADRLEATLTERKINGRLMDFKKKLDAHRAK